jgi:cell division protein DivIC
MFLVSLVVVMILCMVSVKCVELKEKQEAYQTRKEELQAQIEDEQARTEELVALKKYVQTDSYAEEVAEEKLGLVHKDEIIFKVTK